MPKKIEIEDYDHSKELLKQCKIGDKFWRPGEVRGYKVSHKSDRFVVLRKPHFKTYLYTIIDLQEEYMGPHDFLFRDADMRTPEGCHAILQDIFTREGTPSDRSRMETHISKRHGRKLIEFLFYQES